MALVGGGCLTVAQGERALSNARREAGYAKVKGTKATAGTRAVDVRRR